MIIVYTSIDVTILDQLATLHYDVIFSSHVDCRYCSTVAPPVLTSTENVMQIRFVSDASVGNEGFSASYVALNASTSKFLSLVKTIQKI